MEEKIRLAVFGQKRLSREGGIEIVVKELCTRMAQNGCDVTCYNRAGHHVSGAEYDKTIEYDGIRQKVVPTIEKKGLAAVSSSFFAALCSAFGRYDVVHTGAMVLGKSQRLISGKSISRTVPKGQQYITEGTHEAIVSREEFEKAQLVIKSNSHKVLMGSVDFPLKGKVRCGNCRRVMAHNFKQVVPTFWCREGLELVGQTQCTSEVFQVSDIENAVFQALKKELSLLDSLYGDIQKEEQDLKEVHKKANRRKTLMEQELKNLKGEKMRMYEEYAAGTLPLDTYKQKKQECDRRISEVQEQIEQSKAEESAESVVPGTVRAAAEQAENFLNGTRLTAGMVSAFIENVFVHDGGRIVVRFKYEQSIQDAVKALHTG